MRLELHTQAAAKTCRIKSVNWIANLLETILKAVCRMRQGQSEQNLQLVEIQNTLTQQSETLQTILGFLQPPSAVAFEITYEGQTIMAKRKATVDFQLLDNGTATATLTPVDAAGNPTSMPALQAGQAGAPGASVPAWTSSNPAITVAAAADGLSATLTPTSLATGVIITATATLADGVTVLTGSGNPIDVVAGTATAFAIAEQ
jgi:hypothetical protein